MGRRSFHYFLRTLRGGRESPRFSFVVNTLCYFLAGLLLLVLVALGAALSVDFSQFRYATF